MLNTDNKVENKVLFRVVACSDAFVMSDKKQNVVYVDGIECRLWLRAFLNHMLVGISI